MIVKAVEIRGTATFIPAIAIKVVPANEGQRYLLRRSGYGFDPPQIILAEIAAGIGLAFCDPYDWPDDTRTMRVAHEWLREHFDEIEDGAVVDVEFILGERPEPKRSERETEPL
jgi:hypothetical protein